MKLLNIILWLLILSIGLSACSAKPKTLSEAILGKWQEEEGEEKLEFLQDALLITNKDKVSTAEYEVIGDHVLKIKFTEWENVGGNSYTIKASLVNDTLVLYAKQAEKRYKKYKKPKQSIRRIIWQTSVSKN